MTFGSRSGGGACHVEESFTIDLLAHTMLAEIKLQAINHDHGIFVGRRDTFSNFYAFLLWLFSTAAVIVSIFTTFTILGSIGVDMVFRAVSVTCIFVFILLMTI